MSEDNVNDQEINAVDDGMDANDAPQPSELEVLKQRATKLNLRFSPNIGVDKLKAKIDAALNPPKEEAKTGYDPDELTVKDEPSTKLSPRQEMARRHAQIRDEALKLVRIRLTCMDPNKKDFDGEFFSVSNKLIGTVKRYIPYNAEDGWHCESVILDLLKSKQCQIFVKKRTRNGDTVSQGRLINAFAIEVLPPLTPKEIADLAKVQAMADRI